MTAFLKQVADHYSHSEDFSRTLFIFPNRRSLAFFRKYLCERARMESKVRLLPVLTTVSDFYTNLSGLREADNITLLTMLYDAYREVNPKAEPLDDFVWWGGILLADFGDIDRYEVDARGLFANIADINAIKYDYSFLEKEQIEALELLGKHCINEHPSEGKDAAKEFLGIWPMLYPLYERFNSALDKAGLSYPGRIYKKVATLAREGSLQDALERCYPDMSRYVFVGLNALSSSENTVMAKMRDSSIAEFCWDYLTPLLSDSRNVAGQTIRKNVARFKPPFELEKTTTAPVIHVVNVPSATGQARLLPQIIREVPECERGLDFALVLPDESLLPTVLGSIPDSVGSVNVTMGCQLRSSEWAALMRDVLSMQFHTRKRGNGVWSFYHRQVRDILTCGLLRGLLDEEETAAVEAVLARKEIYISEDSFKGTGLPEHYFKAVVKSEEKDSSLADYLLDIIALTAGRMGEEEAVHKEFAMRYYRCVSRLKELSDKVLPRTWANLLDRIAGLESLPFEGEPLGGMQIMGPLETRALDFKHIVILSANEGCFPGREARSSFIPGSLKIAFGLPTREDQDAVWAYYFYRLAGRASDVWLLYDSRTEGLNSGEESRFIKQLKYLYGGLCKVEETAAGAEIRTSGESMEIKKTEEDIQTICQARLSASSIEKYLACPVQFYYFLVKGLKPEDEVSETLDPGLMGSVCHDTLFALYTGEDEMASDEDFDKRSNDEDWPEPITVSLGYLKSWLSREDEIKRKVHSLICLKLHCPAVTGRDLITADIAVRYVTEVVKSDIKKLGKLGKESFTVYALEKKFTGTVCGHRVIGYIDRLDSFEEGKIRVVDYKTGSDKPKVLSPETKADALFSKSNFHKNKAALQFFIYDRLLQQSGRFEGMEIQNTMYAMSDIFRQDVKDFSVSEQFCTEVEKKLEGVIKEMENPEIAFRRADSGGMTCEWCDYRVLCGRYSKE